VVEWKDRLREEGYSRGNGKVGLSLPLVLALASVV